MAPVPPTTSYVILLGKKTSDGTPVALKSTDEGLLMVDSELTITGEGLATESTLADILAKILTIQADLATVKADLDAVKADVSKLPQKVQLHAKIDFSSASEQTIIEPPGAGNRIRLTRLSLSSGGTPQVNVEIDMKSGANSIETVKGSVVAFDYPEHRNLGAGEAFVLQATTADRVIGGVDYYIESV